MKTKIVLVILLLALSTAVFANAASGSYASFNFQITQLYGTWKFLDTDGNFSNEPYQLTPTVEYGEVVLKATGQPYINTIVLPATTPDWEVVPNGHAAGNNCIRFYDTANARANRSFYIDASVFMPWAGSVSPPVPGNPAKDIKKFTFETSVNLDAMPADLVAEPTLGHGANLVRMMQGDGLGEDVATIMRIVIMPTGYLKVEQTTINAAAARRTDSITSTVTQLTTGTWYNLSYQYDFSGAAGTGVGKLYCNGILQLTWNATAGDTNFSTVPGSVYLNNSGGWYTPLKGMVDDFAFFTVKPAAGAFTGTITLNDFTGVKTGLTGSAIITDAANSSETKSFTILDESGNYSIAGVTKTGACTVEAKVAHWLSQIKSGITITAGVGTSNFSLMNGDCSLDNAIDESDFGMISLSWYKALGDPGYDAAADISGDDVIDESDFGILSLNWYQAGPL
jgi:hypothetical protein